MTPAEKNARQRERYATDPAYREAVLARCRAYRAANPEVGRARQQRWRQANPEQAKQGYARDNARRRLNPEHRRKAVERTRRWHLAHPDAKRRQGLMRYALTPEQYDEMLRLQHSVCLICHQPERRSRIDGIRLPLAVDHDHETGEVRGLLCQRCNRVLGWCKDDPTILLSASLYLRRTDWSDESIAELATRLLRERAA